MRKGIKPQGGIEPPDISFAESAVDHFGTEAKNIPSARIERATFTFAE